MASMTDAFSPVLIIAAIFGYIGIGGITCGLFFEFVLTNEEAVAAAIFFGIFWPFSLPALLVILVGRLFRQLRRRSRRRLMDDKARAAFLESLPDDAADAFEAMQVAIRRHKADGWSLIARDEMDEVLAILASAIRDDARGVV